MSPVDLCFFTADGETLTPTDVARSLWSAEQMHGVAISGAMARGLERAVHRDDLRPARYTLDMFRPARMEPFSVHTRVVREGRRICLVDAEIVQGDETCARASAVFLAVTEDPDGSVWRPASSEAPSPPPAEVTQELTAPTIPWYASDEPWGQDFLAHQNAGRKTNWQYGVPVVAGEQPTPFQAVASMADSTTMVCNWGNRGVQYINTDITLSLSRLPRTPEVGLRAADWTGHDGIAVGTATVFDREGVIGTSMVTAVSNSRRTVDFAEHEFTEDGTRISSRV